MIAINKKRTLLFLILLPFFFFIGKRYADQELRRSLQEKRKKVLSLRKRLQFEAQRNIEAKCALAEFYSEVESGDNRKDSIDLMMKLIYEGRCSPGSVVAKVVDVKRKQSWEKTLRDINSKLFSCHNWFDTVKVLSTWLYQNTRVGDINKYNINRVIGQTYVLSRLDLRYLYEVNNSDSVAGTCGFHSYYALLLYDYYGIKSYCFSMKPNPNRRKSGDGHMFNVLENPHDHKWYPVDVFFGIRYLYKGKWLDMEKYFQLAREHALSDVSIETFGTFKFHIQDSPCVPFNSWNIDTAEIVSAELSNYRNHFRILAPYTLKHQFPQQFKPLFDPIAGTYDQPHHVDWIDLARKMPMYGARLFPLLDLKEQLYADSLLSSWKQDQ